MTTNPNILAGYSMEMLRLALRDLGRTIRCGRAGRWEKRRFQELAAELGRREFLGARDAPPQCPGGGDDPLEEDAAPAASWWLRPPTAEETSRPGRPGGASLPTPP